MYLGLDLGTSELKALLLDERHNIVGTAHAPLTVQRPQPGWSEQHPADWWSALEQVMDTLHRQHPQALARLQGVGLSGQMHGAVLLDAREQVLRPAILWNDGRSAPQCQQLTRIVPSLHDITGNLAMPGFTAPKLLWVQAHEPAVFAQVRRVLLPKDWLRLRLTGEAASDMSDASGTLWLNTRRRDWSDEVLSACGLDRSHMPRLLEGSDISGWLKPQWCQRWGLPDRVPVAAGAGDNAASAVGTGMVSPGQGFVSLGTSGVIFLVGTEYRSAPELAVHSFAHALPQLWHQMSVMLSAASAFGWVTRLTGYASEAELAARVDAMPTGQRAQAPLFLPYLQGERTPHNNALARGVFFGLNSSHEAADLAYAVLEGVTLGLMDCWCAMGQTGDTAAALTLVGGGARNATWAQMISSGLRSQILRPRHAHSAAAIGAARLGWLATGGTIHDACQPLPTQDVFTPNADEWVALSARSEKFRKLYCTVEINYT